MKILVAEDSLYQREALVALLEDWGFEVVAVEDGLRAWEVLRSEDAPGLAILDSVMPGLSGPELCRRLRAELPDRPRHVLLLTSQTSPGDVEQGLDAGADDYVGKPFHESELRARVRAGQRDLELRLQLADRVEELERALTRIHQLEGILPICSYCRKIRDGEQAWQPLETFFTERSQGRFSHDICPGCYTDVVEPQLKELGAALQAERKAS